MIPITSRILKDDMQLIADLVEDTGQVNVKSVGLKKARSLAQDFFGVLGGRKLDDELPDFDKNYKLLQSKTQKAKDIPRIDMPVIRSGEVNRLKIDLGKGNIDLFKPFAFKGIQFPKNIKAGSEDAKNFLVLGQKDGDPNDDKIKAKVERVPVKNLKPTQSQIWLEKIIRGILKGKKAGDKPIIASKDGFILDGHHRYGQIMLADPNGTMKVLRVPLGIDMLLKMGRSYGNAIGNTQRN